MLRRLFSRQVYYDKLSYKPRNGAIALDAAADAGHRFLSMFAFPQAGKSYHTARHIGVDLLRPDYHVWLVAPKYEFGAKEFGYIYRDHTELGLIKHATRKHFDVRGGNMVLEYGDRDTWVKVVSADDPSNLRMEQLDCIVLCEASALPSDLYERFLFARVELRKGKVLVPTTPKGYNWVYDAFRVPSLTHVHFQYGPWEGVHRARIGGEPNGKYDNAYWSAVVSAVPDFGDILEPGVHSQESIDRARRILPPQVFAEQYGGDFASYAGAVIPWDPSLHECEPFPIPDDWTHIVGWDPGARDENPTAIMFGSYSPDGTLYWWGEIYEGNRPLPYFVSRMRAMLHGKTPAAIVVDRTARQLRSDLANLGVPTTTSEIIGVEDGCFHIISRMREGKWKTFRGAVPNWVQEVRAYEWDEKNPKKVKVRQRCHAIDGTRYGATVTVELPGQPAYDPDKVEGEDPVLERVWAPERKKWREREEQERLEGLEAQWEDDPFNEMGGRAQEYVFDA